MTDNPEEIKPFWSDEVRYILQTYEIKGFLERIKRRRARLGLMNKDEIYIIELALQNMARRLYRKVMKRFGNDD